MDVYSPTWDMYKYIIIITLLYSGLRMEEIGLPSVNWRPKVYETFPNQEDTHVIMPLVVIHPELNRGRLLNFAKRFRFNKYMNALN